jgi:hypothetical protein
MLVHHVIGVHALKFVCDKPSTYMYICIFVSADLHII